MIAIELAAVTVKYSENRVGDDSAISGVRCPDHAATTVPTRADDDATARSMTLPRSRTVEPVRCDSPSKCFGGPDASRFPFLFPPRQVRRSTRSRWKYS